MIKEIYEGIYDALERKDIPLMKPDLLEPKSRPGFKIYVKPKCSRANSDLRITDYDIMVLYYPKNIDDYYIEHFEMEESFEEMLLGCIELKNGVVIEIDSLDFANYEDLLEVRMSTSIDTVINTEMDNEVMEELELYF